jgi:transcriptional regulator
VYLPAHFQETRIEVMHDLIRAHPFATLVTATGDGFEADHLPFVLDSEPSPLGTLRGHVARANPLWQRVAGNAEALVVFQGVHAYVSPAWYPSKRETGKVVPTWNYAVVHARGRLRVVHETAWLRALVEELTERHEAPRTEPWKVTDAPAEYVEKMLAAIVGIEIRVGTLLGKWKLSQNRPAADREGVARGLVDERVPGAEALAALVRAPIRGR